jgi:hypothetical protein
VHRICSLKAKGVIGASVAYSFFERRIQPLQRRVTHGYENRGVEDPSRMVKDVLSIEEVMRRVTHILSDVYSEPFIPKLFSAKNPPNLVSSHDLFTKTSTQQNVVLITCLNHVVDVG